MAAKHPNARILLVESDEVNIYVMEKTLGKQFHLTVARNGVEALHFAHRKNFDIILTEIQLNHSIDGVELLEELRKDSLNDTAQVWLLTGVGLPEDESYFKELGFDAYFQKPVNHKELIQSIQQALPERIYGEINHS